MMILDDEMRNATMVIAKDKLKSRLLVEQVLNRSLAGTFSSFKSKQAYRSVDC